MLKRDKITAYCPLYIIEDALILTISKLLKKFLSASPELVTSIDLISSSVRCFFDEFRLLNLISI